MKGIKKLELEAQKYRRLRKVFRVLEAVSIAALIIVFVYCAGDPLLDIIGCLAAVVIIPESFLAVSRSTLKASIRDEKLICERELEFYSAIKTECEKFRNEFISMGSEKFISDECNELVWKEEMGIGWLSTKIKEFESKCNEAKEITEKLESIKGLVTF